MKSKRNEVLVIDIDNTVSDHISRLKSCYNYSDNKLDLKKANSIEIVSKDSVLPGAVNAISVLSERYQIHWLSNRFEYLYETTYDWLERNDFCVDNLILVEKFNDKITYLNNIKPKMFIDDLEYDHNSMIPKTATIMIKQLRENKLNFIVFDKNWAEIVKKLTSD